MVEFSPKDDRVTLHSKYTFDNFVVGPNNQFAHATAIAVAEKPATTYNPLFIYGGIGRGKTHLVHAIGNSIIEKHKGLTVRYLSSSCLAADLVESLKLGAMVEFWLELQTCDVLIIDDIYLVDEEQQVQEEIIKGLSSLYEAGKQIIITSEHSPAQTDAPYSRVQEQFEFALIADIQMPVVSTRQEILKKKAEDNEIVLPPEVNSFLARMDVESIHELEGYLIRIGAFAKLTNEPLSLEMAQKVVDVNNGGGAYEQFIR